MKVIFEYFGLFIFSFVVVVGGVILFPKLGNVPATSSSELVGLGLAFIVIAGGFTWFYFATSHRGRHQRG